MQPLGPRAGPVYQTLRRRIANGELTTGTQLPPHAKLASEFHVATMTVRQAILTLESEGMVESIQGRGTFVREPTGHAPGNQSNSEQMLRAGTFLTGSTMGVARVTLQGRILAANAAFERLLGYDAVELPALSFADFTYPDDVAGDRAVWNEFAQGTRDLYQAERRMVRKDGRIIWSRLSVMGVQDAWNRPHSAVAMLENISVRHQIETSLEESRVRQQLALLDAVTANAPDGIYAIDAAGRMTFMNPAAENMLGWTREQLLGTRINDVILAPAEEPSTSPTDMDGTSGTFRRKDHSTFPVEVTRTPIVMSGETTGEVVSFVDMTAEGRAADSLRSSEERFRALFQRAPIGIELADRDGRIIDVNPALESILGYTREELIGQYFGFVSHPDDLAAELLLDHSLDTGELESYALEKRFIRKSGEVIWARLSASDVGAIHSDSFQFAIGMIEDISERRLAEAELHQREERYRSVIEASRDGIVIEDLAGNVQFATARAAAILGYDSPDSLIGLTHLDLIAPEDHVRLLSEVERLVEEGVVEGVRFTAVRRDGTRFPVDVGASLITDDEGRPQALTAVFSDLTERLKSEEELRHRALHDALTDLPNRALFNDRLNSALQLSRRTGSPIAVLMLDLDHFKEVNDALGHVFGDLLLCQVAKRLQRALRASDTVARLGGDEFAVLMVGVPERGALRGARKILASLGDAFAVDEHTFYIAASVGVAMSSSTSDDAGVLLRRADVAMYAAKRSGAGLSVYTPEADPHTKERLDLVTHLRHAIEHDQLFLEYQPKVNLVDGCAEHVEALVRWMHPERGLIPPEQFIGLAEQTGLIRPLSSWVLSEALQQAGTWHRAGLDIDVAVNLSLWNLQDRQLVRNIAGLLSRWQVKPSSLTIEITESAIMSDPEVAMQTVTALFKMGIQISIDDFGTGYSSLAYLKRLPVTEIKLDRSFVLDMKEDDPESLMITRSVIDLGHNLGLQIVAEGVETASQVRMLRQLGCDVAQGYFLSRPIRPDAFETWLSRHTTG